MGVFRNLLGTSEVTFRVGLAGPTLKRISGTELSVRNTADSADAAIRSLLFKTFGNDFELNSGAAGSGADWKFTLRRPSTGMTLDVVIVLPSSGAPTAGDALTVASVAAGVITLQYAAVATGTNMVRFDTTNIVFGTSSPLTMFNNPAGGEIIRTKVTIDTAFTGTPTLSVGIAGTTAKYMPTTAVDLTAAAGTIYEYESATLPAGGIEAIIATYVAGGAGAGAARIECSFVIPS